MKEEVYKCFNCPTLQQKQAEIDTADVLHFDETAELKAKIEELDIKLRMKDRC